MMTSVVHSSTTSEEKRKQFSKGLEEADAVGVRLKTVSDDLAAKQSQLKNSKMELDQKERAIDFQISDAQEELNRLRIVKRQLGKGFLQLSGMPDDDHSRRLKALVDSGDIKKLEKMGDYTTHAFEFRHVYTLTKAQQEAMEMRDQLHRDLMEKFGLKDALGPLRNKVEMLRQSVTNLRAAHTDIDKEHKKALIRLTADMTELSPGRLADVISLQRAHQAMSNAAKKI